MGIEKLIFLFLNQTYVVGTQKNHLNETVLLSTQTYVKSDGQENIYNFTLKKFIYLIFSKPMHVLYLQVWYAKQWGEKNHRAGGEPQDYAVDQT